MIFYNAPVIGSSKTFIMTSRIFKCVIACPRTFVGTVDKPSMLFCRLLKNFVLFSLLRTSKYTSTSKVEQAKWPNLRSNNQNITCQNKNCSSVLVSNSKWKNKSIYA